MSQVILSVDPVRYPLTGIGRYAFELSRELPRVCEDDRILFFDGKEVLDHFVFNDNQTVDDPKSKMKLIKSLAKRSAFISELYFKIKQKRESKVLQGHESCIIHATNFTCPRFEGKKIVSFHDMSAYITPDCQETVRLNILKKECEYTIKHADALITISEASKHSIVDYFGYPPDRIFVTSLACNRDFYNSEESVTRKHLKQVGLGYKQYTLFVGTVEPRKNIITLIQAYRKLPEPLRQQVPLVICGHSGWKSDNIFNEMNRAASEGWLRYLNYVDQKSLLSLYAGAKLFCFPSLYEGFGLPILEAMASGVPVISADNSSLPEVVGDSGILIPALDVEGWANKICDVLESLSLTEALVTKGYQKAKEFSWERCALETKRVYDLVEQF